MAMATDLDLLKPYKSLILGKFEPDKERSGLIDGILKDISGLLNLNMAKSAFVYRKRKGGSTAVQSGDLTVGFLYYSEERTAAWTSDPKIKDRLNHLVLVCVHGSHIAILITDPAWKRSILKRFQGDAKALGLAALKQIPSGLLNAAFVQGPARTLWLTGTHRRTSVKADNKVLSGIDLEFALDPLDDQSFYFSAARCTPQLGSAPAKPVGVVPRDSRVWAGTSRNWEDCRDAIALLLTHLEGVTEPEEAPLPVLAISTSEAVGVEGAFDVSLQPPEVRSETPGGNQEELEAAEDLAYGVQFTVLATDGPNFEAEARLGDRRLGTIEIGNVNLSHPDHVTWDVAGEPDSESEREDHDRLLRFCGRDWLKVRYDSGHTLSDGAIFEIRHRDLPFKDFDWVDLGGFEWWEEKPYTKSTDKNGRERHIFVPDQVGKQTSLFCWVQKFWPNLAQDTVGGGWLACNDGAMEIADFIHLDPDGPALTLIHVKGAGSDEKDRGISVSSYEVVTGQAVKNLRYLDRLILEDGLDKGLAEKIRSLVWFDRKPSPHFSP